MLVESQAFEELFRYTSANESENLKFQVTFSMLEIYMEQVEDLLSDPKLRKKGGLKVRQNPKLGRFYVDGLSKVPVASYEEIANMMDTGTANRTVAASQVGPNWADYILRWADWWKRPQPYIYWVQSGLFKFFCRNSNSMSTNSVHTVNT